jgi:hypothetical protein
MACKDLVFCEILSDAFTQISLGLLPTGTFAAMFPTECAAHSRRITEPFAEQSRYRSRMRDLVKHDVDGVPAPDTRESAAWAIHLAQLRIPESGRPAVAGGRSTRRFAEVHA